MLHVSIRCCADKCCRVEHGGAALPQAGVRNQLDHSAQQNAGSSLGRLASVVEDAQLALDPDFYRPGLTVPVFSSQA